MTVKERRQMCRSPATPLKHTAAEGIAVRCPPAEQTPTEMLAKSPAYVPKVYTQVSYRLYIQPKASLHPTLSRFAYDPTAFAYDPAGLAMRMYPQLTAQKIRDVPWHVPATIT